jgi:hypothetical protein
MDVPHSSDLPRLIIFPLPASSESSITWTHTYTYTKHTYPTYFKNIHSSCPQPGGNSCRTSLEMEPKETS